jgi:hypothetical protein
MLVYFSLQATATHLLLGLGFGVEFVSVIFGSDSPSERDSLAMTLHNAQSCCECLHEYHMAILLPDNGGFFCTT